MRIYFAADNLAQEKLQTRFSRIIDVLSRAGVLVMSNLANKNLTGFSGADLEKINQSGETMLSKMDGLVVEGTQPIAESGYLIAFALTHRKPILYIVEKGRTIDPNLVHLKKDKSIGHLLALEHYTESGLDELLVNFIQTIERGGRELPKIKFTLRVTSRIERYLHWKTHNTKLTKADFLREMIEEMIENDTEYQRYVQKLKE